MAETPTIRRCRDSEVASLIDLWLEFAAEMARQDPHNELADIDLRSAQREYRREALADPDARTFVAVVDAADTTDGGTEDGGPATDDAGLVGYVTVSYESSAPVFARGDRAGGPAAGSVCRLGPRAGLRTGAAQRQRRQRPRPGVLRAPRVRAVAGETGAVAVRTPSPGHEEPARNAHWPVASSPCETSSRV